MKRNTPEITKIPLRIVLTVTTVGDPNVIMADTMPLLYGTAYGTKFKVFKPKGKKMDVGPLSAFWPDAHLKPKSKWTGIWNLEISPFVVKKDVIQKDPKQPMQWKKLPAATVAQVVYIGPYSGEEATIRELHAYIKAQGYVMTGPHEEVYLSKPGPKAKTIIRYVVKRKKA